MKKIILFFILAVVLCLGSGFVWQGETAKATSTVPNLLNLNAKSPDFENIKEGYSITQKIIDKIKDIFDFIKNVFKPIWQKANKFYSAYLEKYIGKYVAIIQNNIKQGIGEEKKEISQAITGGVSGLWGDIKTMFNFQK